MSGSSTHISTPSGTAKALGGNKASHPAYQLLSRAHPNDSETVTNIFTDKVINKPLLLSASTDRINGRAARRHIRLRKNSYTRKHTRPKPLSASEKRKLGLYKLKPQECQYQVYRELNLLWRRYILEVLGYVNRDGDVQQHRLSIPITPSSVGGLIASADFHGMEVEIARCADQARVGLKGIVVRETRSTLTLIMNKKENKPHRKVLFQSKPESTQHDSLSATDRVRMIMKKGSVFKVVIGLPGPSESFTGKSESSVQTPEEGEVLDATSTSRQLVLELHGDQLEIRPVERAVKKFKWKPMDYF